eukprot:scaffold361_cov248-Pinguiococcus_pyrenoidosus.AAC.34
MSGGCFVIPVFFIGRPSEVFSGATGNPFRSLLYAGVLVCIEGVDDFRQTDRQEGLCQLNCQETDLRHSMVEEIPRVARLFSLGCTASTGRMWTRRRFALASSARAPFHTSWFRLQQAVEPGQLLLEDLFNRNVEVGALAQLGKGRSDTLRVEAGLVLFRTLNVDAGEVVCEELVAIGKLDVSADHRSFRVEEDAGSNVVVAGDDGQHVGHDVIRRKHAHAAQETLFLELVVELPIGIVAKPRIGHGHHRRRAFEPLANVGVQRAEQAHDVGQRASERVTSDVEGVLPPRLDTLIVRSLVDEVPLVLKLVEERRLDDALVESQAGVLVPVRHSEPEPPVNGDSAHLHSDGGIPQHDTDPPRGQMRRPVVQIHVAAESHRDPLALLVHRDAYHRVQTLVLHPSEGERAGVGALSIEKLQHLHVVLELLFWEGRLALAVPPANAALAAPSRFSKVLVGQIPPVRSNEGHDGLRVGTREEVVQGGS